jgi:hypothetical protein
VVDAWLHVVVHQRSNGMWEARALEHDLGAEARTIDLSIGTLLDRVFAHAAFDRNHGRVPLSAFPAAPLWYWSLAELARPLRTVSARGLDVSILTAAHRVPAHLVPRAARCAGRLGSARRI